MRDNLERGLPLADRRAPVTIAGSPSGRGEPTILFTTRPRPRPASSARVAVRGAGAHPRR